MYTVQVPGCGLFLARPLYDGLNTGGSETLTVQAEVGTTPILFNPLIDNYTEFDIMHLILFYNESFGILMENDLPTRHTKVKLYLTY